MARYKLYLLGCLLGAASLLHAGAIEVDFVDAEIPTGGPGSTASTPTPLPAFMGPASDAEDPDYVGNLLFLKFSIPDIADIATINSFIINIDFYDNGDGGGESADVDFAQPGENLVLASPAFTRVNHYTSSSPYEWTYSLDSDEIADILPSLEDGTFRIRIAQDSGDYFVEDASVQIDATLDSNSTTPEPSTGPLTLGAFCGVAGWLWIRRRRVDSLERA